MRSLSLLRCPFRSSLLYKAAGAPGDGSGSSARDSKKAPQTLPMPSNWGLSPFQLPAPTVQSKATPLHQAPRPVHLAPPMHTISPPKPAARHSAGSLQISPVPLRRPHAPLAVGRHASRESIMLSDILISSLKEQNAMAAGEEPASVLLRPDKYLLAIRSNSIRETGTRKDIEDYVGSSASKHCGASCDDLQRLYAEYVRLPGGPPKSPGGQEASRVPNQRDVNRDEQMHAVHNCGRHPESGLDLPMTPSSGDLDMTGNPDRRGAERQQLLAVLLALDCLVAASRAATALSEHQLGAAIASKQSEIASIEAKLSDLGKPGSSNERGHLVGQLKTRHKELKSIKRALECRRRAALVADDDDPISQIVQRMPAMMEDLAPYTSGTTANTEKVKKALKTIAEYKCRKGIIDRR